ncbi:unnamed protein product [Symbiodinium sp. KB8]|nr:unnamed protein product [Symbiodinium sp. KB8]
MKRMSAALQGRAVEAYLGKQRSVRDETHGPTEGTPLSTTAVVPKEALATDVASMERHSLTAAELALTTGQLSPSGRARAGAGVTLRGSPNFRAANAAHAGLDSSTISSISAASDGPGPAWNVSLASERSVGGVAARGSHARAEALRMLSSFSQRR